jgi:hypothetical protein
VRAADEPYRKFGSLHDRCTVGVDAALDRAARLRRLEHRRVLRRRQQHRQPRIAEAEHGQVGSFGPAAGEHDVERIDAEHVRDPFACVLEHGPRLPAAGVRTGRVAGRALFDRDELRQHHRIDRRAGVGVAVERAAAVGHPTIRA